MNIYQVDAGTNSARHTGDAMIGADGPEPTGEIAIVCAASRGQARAIATNEWDIPFVAALSIRLVRSNVTLPPGIVSDAIAWEIMSGQDAHKGDRQ